MLYINLYTNFSNILLFQCDICLNELPLSDSTIKLCCEHKFCNSCWKEYLTCKIKRKDSSNIYCPALHCHILVPTELIENIVSPEMARRYFDLNIEVRRILFSSKKL
jgi:hypothetical protein